MGEEEDSWVMREGGGGGRSSAGLPSPPLPQAGKEPQPTLNPAGQLKALRNSLSLQPSLSRCHSGGRSLAEGQTDRGNHPRNHPWFLHSPCLPPRCYEENTCSQGASPCCAPGHRAPERISDKCLRAYFCPEVQHLFVPSYIRTNGDPERGVASLGESLECWEWGGPSPVIETGLYSTGS